MTSNRIVPAPRLPALRPAQRPEFAGTVGTIRLDPRSQGEQAVQSVRSIARGAGRVDKADLLMWLVAVVVCMYLWRFQGLFRILAVTKVTLISMCLALLVFANDNHPARTLRGIDSPTARAALSILALVLVSTPFSVYRRASVEFLTTDFLLNLAMMILVAASIRRPRDVEWHIRACLFGAATYTLMSLRWAGKSDRLAGQGYYDANDFGTMLVCMVPLAIHLTTALQSRLGRLVGAGLLGTFLYAVILTSSRGAFLGLLVVGMFVLVAYRTIPPRVRIGVALSGTLLFAVAAKPEFWERMGTMLNPEQDYNFSGNVSGRGEVWKRGVGYMLSNPFGVGPSAFPWAEGRSAVAIERQSEGMGFKWSASHNSFLQIGAELGVLGLAAILLAFKGGIVGLRRIASGRAHGPNELANQARAVQGALIGFCVAGFFVSFGYSSLLYWLLGVTIGILKLDKPTPRLPVVIPDGK